MFVQTGRSECADACTAVAEATAGIAGSPTLVLAFTSSRQPATEVARALAERFPVSQVVGCTTTGEIVDGERSTGSLAITALTSDRARFSAQLIPLAEFGAARARACVDAALAALQVDREGIDSRRMFALLFVDGLSRSEETVSATIAEALEGIPLIGGSAGDDLRFQRTEVMCGGEARSNAAVVVVGVTEGGFDIFKHQHFVATNKAVCVTRVDTAARRVFELDGRPAAEVYAEAVNVDPAAFSADVAFLHPLTLRSHGELYVRSVQAVHDDGSITFYCAVEEGMVLEFGGHEDMVQALTSSVDAFLAHHPRPAFFLGFNCILRALEMTNGKRGGEVAGVWRALAPTSVGFDTYGEQLNGLHINQTLVGICLR